MFSRGEKRVGQGELLYLCKESRQLQFQERGRVLGGEVRTEVG